LDAPQQYVIFLLFAGFLAGFFFGVAGFFRRLIAVAIVQSPSLKHKDADDTRLLH
jgi:hypothetical protein